MASNYTKHVNPRGKNVVTPQTEAIPGREDEMVKNNAGGYVFVVNDWDRLDRFLVLGTEGGTYYASEKKLTVDNAKAIQKLVNTDGLRVVNRVVEISDAGRAPKNDPALFVLAMCTAAKDEKVRKAAIAALPKVARIGTHLFHFAEYVQAFRGWGRAIRKGVADWYNNKTPNELVNQLVKYQARDGWSHRDLLRLAHPKTGDADKNTLYKWTVKPESFVAEVCAPGALDRYRAAQELLRETDAKTALKAIQEYNLPRECVNTQLLNNIEIWDALLQKMPITAMIRNLGKMTSVGLLKPNSAATAKVIETLTNKDVLVKGRVHPLAVLVALNTYSQGHGVKGSLAWTVVQDIADALDDAFYLAFDAVVPTGKRWLLGLDVSGSMTWGDIAGMPGITPNIAATAMAMVTARVEKQKAIMGFADSFRDLGISSKDSLKAALKKTQNMSFGGTDCALPMMYAAQNKIDVDTFVVYTDNETWAGRVQPVQALRQYRHKTGIPAKLIVVGMTATSFTIADPSDGGMMDVVGFDTAAPDIMADFAKGQLSK